jgi:multicomponent Na+:H+ antiporter subunit A
MTQLLVEILTVVILVLALQALPLTYKHSKCGIKASQVALASVTGLTFTIVLGSALSGSHPQQLQNYFINHSLALAYGKNVVNVILVDFRAFDTLGEVMVVLGATVGVWLLARRQYH